MPRAKQLTVRVPDRPGMLGEVGFALGAKKANILAFTAWVEGDRGAIRMVVDKPAVAKKVLAVGGWETTEEEVLEVALANTPGNLGADRPEAGRGRRQYSVLIPWLGWERSSSQCIFRRLGSEGRPESRTLALKSGGEGDDSAELLQGIAGAMTRTG